MNIFFYKINPLMNMNIQRNQISQTEIWSMKPGVVFNPKTGRNKRGRK